MFLSIKRGPALITLIGLVFFLSLAGFCLTGCGRHSAPLLSKKSVENGEKEDEKQWTGQQEGAESVVLYFADNHTACLVKEERDITEEADDPMLFALGALIEGPMNSDLGRTIPADVKVLDISIAEEIAQVNFSRELQTSHWGGSTGEILTVYSIVNTLSQFPEIKQVKILIDGEEIETLVGHMELDKPLEPDYGLVSP